MVGDTRGQAGRELRAAVLGDELAELAASRRNLACALGVARAVSEQLRVLMNEHVRTRSRWDDDRPLGRREHVERVTRDLPRLVVKSGIVGGLTAAGQPVGHSDLEAEALE